MSLLRRPPVVDHPLSVEEFEAGGSKFDCCELWDGALWVREPGGGYGGEVGGELYVALRTHVRQRGLGWTPVVETGYRIPGRSATVLAPDLSFVSKARLPHPPERGFWPAVPEFVVEIRSPSDPWPDVLKKCGLWLSLGALVAWAIDPVRRRVVVLRLVEAAQEARSADEVDAAPALPGFRVRVGDLFRGL